MWCDLEDDAVMFAESKYYSALTGWPGVADVSILFGTFYDLSTDATIPILPEITVYPIVSTERFGLAIVATTSESGGG